MRVVHYKEFKLTEGRIKVLVFLRSQLRRTQTRGIAAPNEIGYAMDDGTFKHGYGLQSQGAGRLGGRMAAMLIKDGLVDDASSLRGGFPGYRINSNGLAAIAHILEEKPR